MFSLVSSRNQLVRAGWRSRVLCGASGMFLLCKRRVTIFDLHEVTWKSFLKHRSNQIMTLCQTMSLRIQRRLQEFQREEIWVFPSFPSFVLKSTSVQGFFGNSLKPKNSGNSQVGPTLPFLCLVLFPRLQVVQNLPRPGISRVGHWTFLVFR